MLSICLWFDYKLTSVCCEVNRLQTTDNFILNLTNIRLGYQKVNKAPIRFFSHKKAGAQKLFQPIYGPVFSWPPTNDTCYDL